MPKPVGYEQIRREVLAKRKLKPWEVVIARGHEEDEDESTPAAESPEMTGRAMREATDPMRLAEKKAKVNAALAPMGEMANPETMMARKGKKRGRGLIQLLMGMMQ